VSDKTQICCELPVNSESFMFLLEKKIAMNIEYIILFNVSA